MNHWHKLERGKDAGGVRWFLGGEPVHAGESLLLRLPHTVGGGSCPVRFETSHGEPVLYLRTGRKSYVDEDGEPCDDGVCVVCRPETGRWDDVDLRRPDKGRRW